MAAAVRFDVEIPTCREGVFVPCGFATPEQIVACVCLAERLGYDAVWATDFITATPMSGVPAEERPAWYEPMVTLAYAAARTSRIKLGTGVIVLPYRDPVILAKQVATLDRLSQGRFLLGVGLGAWRDELAAVAAWRRRPHRGEMANEFLAVLRKLLDGGDERVSFEGRYIAIRDVALEPAPLQSPLPIYMPARNDDALMRVLRHGDGLMALSTQAAERKNTLARLAAEHGARVADIDVIAEGELCLGATREEAVASYRRTRIGRYRASKGMLDAVLANNWIGTVDDVIAQIGRVREQGIDHFNVLHIAADEYGERIELMHRFAEEVMPAIS